MCNLYRMRTAHEEVARYFDATSTASNTPEEVYPGTPGLVVTEQEGTRSLRSMTWGFPLRLKGMKPEAKPKPVNNIADLEKPMWIGLARKPQWRCLIPFTEFAESEGEKGRMTRTWFRVQGQPMFAWAGLWRVSDEWGPVYSGVMTDANEAVAPVHDRMPVLLHRDEYERWLHGDFDEAVAFQTRVFPPNLIDMEKTADLWVKKKAPSNTPSSLL